MTTIADIRERVRRDLGDIDPDQRWDDDQLDRHIERALNELSLRIPREASAVIPLAAGSRTISVAGLGSVIAIEAVEYPTDEFPPVYVRFSHWEDDVMLHLERTAEGGDARVYYLALHTIDGSGTTLPAMLEDVLATGAGAYAAIDWASRAIDRLNPGGERVAERYAAWGRAAQTAFAQLLVEHQRRQHLRGRRLYTPA